MILKDKMIHENMINKFLFDLNQLSKYMASISSRKSSLQSSFIFIFVLSIFIPTLNALHIQQHEPISQKPYDPDTYSNQLTSLQTRLTTDINTIKQKFTNINMGLAKTNISSSDKVIFLQENLANQRDSLYNIQTYLNVPFALKSCQCVNLTKDSQTSLQNQVQTASASIKQLENLLNKDKSGNLYENPNCVEGNCEAVELIKKNIEQLQNYKKIINETVTSQCCKFVNYIYRDNLVDTQNWVYGNLTEQQYRLSLFQISNQQNLTQCPSDRPFADLSNNVCLSCPPITPLFNLEKRQCQERCQASKLLFSLALHKCDINRTCEQGKLFNDKLQVCQIDLGTDSNCPNSRPVWNNTSIQCQKCAVKTPYFDLGVRQCRQCTLNEIWQNYTSQCIDKHILPIPCPNLNFFNTKTLKCQKIPTNPTNNNQDNAQTNTSPTQQPSENTQDKDGPDTYSNCPPSAPFWSSSDFSCHSCPQATPFFNLSINNCSACPPGTKFVQESSACKNASASSEAVKCKIDEVFNANLNKCESTNPNRMGLCPPETPNWNTVSMSCQQCNAQTPFWNQTTSKCQNCQNYTAWDQVSATCKSTLKKCQSGFILVISTNTCQQIKCSNENPVFNTTTNQCEACTIGTTYNNNTFVCQSTTNKKTSVCPSERPYWNQLKLSCVACPVGQTLNATTKKCESTPTDTHQQLYPLNLEHSASQKAHLTNINKLTGISHLTKVSLL